MGKYTFGETLEEYEEKEKELLILTEGGMGGANLGNNLILAEIYAIAYIDVESNELKRERIRLRWLADEEPSYVWLYNLKRFSFYRITCRLIKEEYRNPKIIEDAYFVTSVIERDIKEPRLEKVLEDYNTPKYINVLNLKKFKLDKEFGWYEKNVKLLDSKCTVYLKCDRKDRENAEVAIKAFEEIYTNPEEWVHKIKAGAARMMTDRANDWSDEEREITEQEFASRIKIREMTINADGSYSVSCSDDGMFARHRIEVEGRDINSVDNAHI